MMQKINEPKETLSEILHVLTQQRGRRLRVLLLAHSLSRTGSPLVVASLFENLRDAVDLFTVSLDQGALLERFQALGPAHSLFDTSHTISRLMPRGMTLRINGKAVQQHLKRWGVPDLIYVNSVTGLHAARYLHLGAAPCILHVHELDDGLTYYPQQAPHLFFEWPTYYVAVSQAVREALQNFNVAENKIKVVHEWIETEGVEVASPAEKSQFDTATPPWVIGGSGHVSWRKGIELWLLMAAHLAQLVGKERVRFVWVGLDESDEARQARLKAQKMGLNDVVEWVPVTDNPQSHFARFDVFAMTSWEDPCPLVVLENMLLQTPVACFAPGGGAHEEVGETGIVIETFDPHMMAQHIAQLLQNEAQRKSLGIRARERVLKGFSPCSQVPKVANLMRQALDVTKTS